MCITAPVAADEYASTSVAADLFPFPTSEPAQSPVIPMSEDYDSFTCCRAFMVSIHFRMRSTTAG
jgi:hypothetical protein